MSYTTRQLRCGTDVFGADGAYVGTVVWRVVGDPRAPEEHMPPPVPSDQDTRTGPPSFSGESIGPAPTASVGNGAPGRQSAATAYASGAGAGGAAVTHLVTIRLLVALNWSGFRPRLRRIPVSQVQVASLERIVLTVPETALM